MKPKHLIWILVLIVIVGVAAVAWYEYSPRPEITQKEIPRQQAQTQQSQGDCFDKAAITGYYGVQLSDYDPTATTTVTIDGQEHTYNASFIEMAKVKTGGISLKGENLVYAGSQWRIQQQQLDPPHGWFPEERDFTTLRTITTLEDGKKRSYPQAFVQDAALEGSGKVAEGEVLGWPEECRPTDGLDPWLSPQCDSQWHIKSVGFTASGTPVAVGDVAVDQKFLGTHVTIFPTPPGFENIALKGTDTGPNIGVGRKSLVDLFGGWGTEGLKRVLLANLDDTPRYKVCFKK
jgi:hypothetical protein